MKDVELICKFVVGFSCVLAGSVSAIADRDFKTFAILFAISYLVLKD